MNREDLYFGLLYLIPDAKFSFFSVNENQDISHVANPIMIDEWCIDWREENSSPCPSRDQLLALDKIAVAQYFSDLNKQERNKQKSADLSLVACYNVAKQNNNALTFSDYLDSLEAASSALITNLNA